MSREVRRGLEPSSVLDLLDSAYQVHSSADTWLRQVARSAHKALDCGCGLHAYLVDASKPDRFEMLSPMGVGLDPSWRACWRQNWWDVFMAPLDPVTLRTLHGYGICSYATDVWDAGAARLPDYAEYLSRLASSRYGRTHQRYLRGPARPKGEAQFYPDSFNIVAMDAGGHGCVLIANLPESVRPWSTPALEHWSRVAGHVAAGLRLQLRSTSGAQRIDDDCELILGTRGKVVHAAGRPAEHKATREALRESMLRAQDKRSSAPASEVLEFWRALHLGRWSVLDQFDSDGTRFIVARPNEPACIPPSDDTLSTREKQVAALLENGHSNKNIAYELGISESTAATHVQRIMTKLGAGTRVALIGILKRKRSVPGARSGSL